MVALYAHDTDKPLGRLSRGTLTIEVDDHGLAYDIDLPDTTVGRDVRESVRRGDIQGSSFGFRVRENKIKGDVELLTDIDLIEVSPVTFPAYSDTQVVVSRGRSSRVFFDQRKLSRFWEKVGRDTQRYKEWQNGNG